MNGGQVWVARRSRSLAEWDRWPYLTPEHFLASESDVRRALGRPNSRDRRRVSVAWTATDGLRRVRLYDRSAAVEPHQVRLWSCRGDSERAAELFIAWLRGSGI